MRIEYDVAVIGGGVLGAFHALAALRRGLRTLLIERDRWPISASARNFGMIIPAAMPAGPWRARGLRSVEIYRELRNEFGLEADEVGLAFVAADRAELDVLEEFAASETGRGFHTRLATPAEALEHSPALRAEHVTGMLRIPDQLRVEPRRILRKLIGHLVEHAGLVFRNGTTAVGVDRLDRGVRIRTSRGERFAAAHAFVCSGSDVATLLPAVYDDAGLRHVKLQMLRLRTPPGYRLGPMLAFGPTMRRYPTFADCRSAAALPPPDPEFTRRGIHVLLAQESGGSLVLGDSHRDHSIARGVGPRRDERTDELILGFANHRLHLDQCRITQRWIGVYTAAADGLFQRTIDDRVHICTGLGGRGMTAAPALAEEQLREALREAPVEGRSSGSSP